MCSSFPDSRFFRAHTTDSIRTTGLGINVKLPSLSCLPNVNNEERNCMREYIIRLRTNITSKALQAIDATHITVTEGPPNLRGAPQWIICIG